MKRLFIIRHAKSDHGPQYGTDFERPLNSRGRKDAHRMATELKKVVNRLDRALISSAQRTRQTAARFIETFGMENSGFTYHDALYLPQEGDIWKTVRAVENDPEIVAVFTHNPAAEILFHRYHPGVKLPTCSIIELHFDGDRWSDVGPENVRFISHKYPKMYD